jgi:hypothetical protein
MDKKGDQIDESSAYDMIEDIKKVITQGIRPKKVLEESLF